MNDFKISVRQICFMTIGLITASKLIFMTSITAEYAKEGILFSIAADMLVNAVFIFIALKLDEKFGGKTIFEILSERIGVPAAKIIYFIFFAIFFLNPICPL